MSPPDPLPTLDRGTLLIGFLQDLKSDDRRGPMAILRGGLSPHERRHQAVWPLLACFGGIPEHPEIHRAEVVRHVAGMFMLPNLQHEAGAGNFGHACQSLVGSDERKNLYHTESPGPVAVRFLHLLAAHRGEVCGRVLRLMRRLSQQRVTLDFIRLHDDLIYWGDRSKASWAASFWRAPENEKKEAAP